MKELNIIMDNCDRQNKNQTIIRMAAYIVETTMFQKKKSNFLDEGTYQKHI